MTITECLELYSKDKRIYCHIKNENEIKEILKHKLLCKNYVSKIELIKMFGKEIYSKYFSNFPAYRIFPAYRSKILIFILPNHNRYRVTLYSFEDIKEGINNLHLIKAEIEMILNYIKGV